MITDLKPYPEYKESGLPWLGQVPGHWSVRRIKTVLHEIDCRSTDGAGTLLSLTRVRGLIPRNDMTEKVHSAKTLVGYKCYRPGQIVMNRMQAWSGMFGAGAIDGLVSPDYAIFDVLGGHAVKLVLERIKAPDLVAQFALESKGIGSGFNRLYTDRFGAIRISLPPLDEQAAIVKFLDWATGRLTRTIRAKRKMVSLLNEQKQAIIHRAVTRGLDPSVPLKPSGIPWLGDIPAHWDLLRLKWVLRLQRGFDLPADRRKTGSVPVYSSGGHIDNHSVALADPPGVVIGRYGSTDAVFYVTEPYWPHNTALFTTTFYDNRARWCFYLLRSIAKGSYAGKSAVPGVDRKDLFDIFVPRPPVEEQLTIAIEIDKQLAIFDVSIASITNEINLLREYRTRLVADVVTGKLDVREAATHLPDEAPPEPDEDNGLDMDLEPADEDIAI